MANEKRPRQYFTEIIGFRTAEERRKALAAVPEDCRLLVAYYVHDYFARRGIGNVPCRSFNEFKKCQQGDPATPVSDASADVAVPSGIHD